MKIISAIQAPQGHGKTPTLRELRSLLVRSQARGENVIYDDGDDFQTIIILKDNRKVGIRSCGDPGCFQIEDLESFLDCEFIFSATRSRGESCNIVHEFAHRHGYEKIWTKTYAFSVRNDLVRMKLNKRKGRELHDLLTSYLVTL